MNSNYIDWFNENEGRAYPVSEKATQVSDTGVILPTDVLTDMGLMVDPVYTDVRLSSLRVTAQYVTLGVSSGNTALLIGTYLRSAIQPYTAYPLTGVVDNVSGWVVLGGHRAIGIEDYRFATAAQSAIEGRVIRGVAPIPVQGLAKAYGDPAVRLQGIVRLRAGAGLIIGRDMSLANHIYVKLDEGTIHSIIGPCNQPADKTNCKNAPFRTINGVSPDGNGSITVEFI